MRNIYKADFRIIQYLKGTLGNPSSKVHILVFQRYYIHLINKIVLTFVNLVVWGKHIVLVGHYISLSETNINVMNAN